MSKHKSVKRTLKVFQSCCLYNEHRTAVHKYCTISVIRLLIYLVYNMCVCINLLLLWKLYFPCNQQAFCFVSKHLLFFIVFSLHLFFWFFVQFSWVLFGFNFGKFFGFNYINSNFKMYVRDLEFISNLFS